MSATDELRRMLDERGVPYETNDDMGASETRWNGFTAYQLTPNAKLVMHPTPEQAIAATLGSTTHADRLLVELNNDRRINKQLKMANALLRKSEEAKIERIKALESLVREMRNLLATPAWDRGGWTTDGRCFDFDVRMVELGIEVGE